MSKDARTAMSERSERAQYALLPDHRGVRNAEAAALALDVIAAEAERDALAADLETTRRALAIVRSMAVNGPGPGTTPEQALTTIAAFVDKRLAASVVAVTGNET